MQRNRRVTLAVNGTPVLPKSPVRIHPGRSNRLVVERFPNAEGAIVRVEVNATQVEVFWIDPENPPPDPSVFNTGTFLWGNYINNYDGGLIAGQACITVMAAGISAPSEAADNQTQLPDACGTDLPAVIMFQPDGSYALPGDPRPGTGMTLVIQDSSSAQIYYSIIEMFPGGLIRKYDEMPAP